MARVVWTEIAREDIRSYARYTANKQHSWQGARNLVRAFRESCQLYAQNPLMGTSRTDLGKDIRSFTCGTPSNPRGFVVIYRPVENGIEVVRIFRGSQDYPRLLT